MGSARVRYLRTSLFVCFHETNERAASEWVSWKQTNECVNTVQKHFPCCNLFVLFILRFSRSAYPNTQFRRLLVLVLRLPKPCLDALDILLIQNGLCWRTTVYLTTPQRSKFQKILFKENVYLIIRQSLRCIRFVAFSLFLQLFTASFQAFPGLFKFSAFNDASRVFLLLEMSIKTRNKSPKTWRFIVLAVLSFHAQDKFAQILIELLWC